MILAVRGASAQPADAQLRVEPREILVDLLYSGAPIHVSGESRAGEDLVVVCSGEESTVELKQKGKLWGLIWVNTGDISFKHVPLFYQVASAKKLGDLAAEADLIRAGVGYTALAAKAAPRMDEERRRSFSELMKLKEHEGLYSIQDESLEIQPRKGGLQEFSTTFHFPSSVKPGEYRIRLMRFVEGSAVTLADAVITVRLAGAAAFIRSLSINHGLAYGILSVVIALAAGMLTGFIFGRRPRKSGR
jgi:uncharacterized protein (TIGR02186 family)